MEEQNVKAIEGQQKKKGVGAKFVTFLSMGGIFVVLFAAIAIIVLISFLTK